MGAVPGQTIPLWDGLSFARRLAGAGLLRRKARKAQATEQGEADPNAISATLTATMGGTPDISAIGEMTSTLAVTMDGAPDISAPVSITATATVTMDGTPDISAIGVLSSTTTVTMDGSANLTGGGVSNPEDIFGSNVVFWGEDSATLNGSDVSSWTNLYSGDSQGLDQATASNQPAWQSTGGPNSTACMECNGAEWVNYAKTWIAADTDFTVYVVFKTATVDSDLVWNAFTDTQLAHDKVVTTNFDQIAASFSADTWYMVRVRRIDDTTLGLQIGNGTESTTSISAASVSVSDLYAAYWSNAEINNIAFLLVVTADPSTSEDDDMRTYLNDGANGGTGFNLGLT